jgi:hypothetical protein
MGINIIKLSTDFSSFQLSVGDSHGKLVVEEELEVSL